MLKLHRLILHYRWWGSVGKIIHLRLGANLGICAFWDLLEWFLWNFIYASQGLWFFDCNSRTQMNGTLIKNCSKLFFVCFFSIFVHFWLSVNLFFRRNTLLPSCSTIGPAGTAILQQLSFFMKKCCFSQKGTLLHCLWPKLFISGAQILL